MPMDTLLQDLVAKLDEVLEQQKETNLYLSQMIRHQEQIAKFLAHLTKFESSQEIKSSSEQG